MAKSKEPPTKTPRKQRSSNKNLVIVESPAKAKTIEKFLGKDFVVRASYGHVRDLPKYRLGIDIDDSFTPKYSNLKDKAKVIKELKTLANKSLNIYLATDPDREGEAIAWHIKEAINDDNEKFKRIIFSEITKQAVQTAISNARDINYDLVDAQQARRILDRLIGYKLSPILSKKIQRGLSAGRVQSVCVKLICEREKEIQAFIPEEYWVIDTVLMTDTNDAVLARLVAKESPDKPITITNESDARTITDQLNQSQFTVHSVTTRPLTRNPYPPFITSTLQQEASRRFGWSTKKTMIVAQQLYEGISVKNETVGLITYMRTDSVRVADEAITAARSYITSQFGDPYLPDSPRQYKAKGQAVQDAHEAIRPTYITYTPTELKDALSPDQSKLYKVIWERFIASQMTSAQLKSTKIIFKASHKDTLHFLKTTGSQIIFDGFKRVHDETKEDHEQSDEPDSNRLPALTESQSLKLSSTDPQQKFTQPQPRYTEASLIKSLEENGIGRPSTYAPTMSTIQDRGYVIKTQRQLSPTDLGQLVNDKLEHFFHTILDVHFTAQLETQLDEIMVGHHNWTQIVQSFYDPFEKLVTVADEKMEKVNTDKPTDEICDKCQHPMVIKTGRFGEFKACSNYPECKNTQAIVQEIGVNCPDCDSSLIQRKSRKGKVFFGCSAYPKCKFAVWDKPINQACPHCDSTILLEKNTRGTQSLKCVKCEKPIEASD